MAADQDQRLDDLHELQDVEYRMLLPGLLLADPHPSGRPRRTVRDWAVDTCAFLLCLGVGALFWGLEADHIASGIRSTDLLLLGDALAGLLLCVSLWWRRRWPVHLALVAAVLGSFSAASSGAGLVLLLTVAVHRRLAVVLAVAGLNVAVAFVYFMIRPDPDLPMAVSVAFTAAIGVAVLAFGQFVRARRQLVHSLRERAARAEAEQQAQVAHARRLERTRIAREMHDVLAHRLSLLSMHAGALEYRPDASPEQLAAGLAVVRDNAHQALEDLRQVIGVLREEDPPGERARPQPVLADLSSLVAETRAAGTRVDLDLGGVDPRAVPAATGRTAYRVVQEGLTNVRKHAPGAVAAVRLGGAPGSGLTVEVRNPRPVLPAPSGVPGGGTGLVGLLERATFAGGRLEHGWTGDGEFRLSAWLPWPA